MKMEDVEQMNYAMAIVGHGRYPEGVLSALKLLIGTTEGMTAFNLDENTTHERFEQCLNDFLKENKHLNFQVKCDDDNEFLIVV